jgi:hypothetical protein
MVGCNVQPSGFLILAESAMVLMLLIIQITVTSTYDGLKDI